MNICEELKTKIVTEFENKDYYLYYIDTEKISDSEHLIIYISMRDKKCEVSLDQCVEATNIVNEFIDDYIDQEYILEISSPGINRTLYTDEHLKDVIDDVILVKLKKEKIIGKLVKFDNDMIYLENQKIDRNLIKKVEYKGIE